jgi:hypothetical protein
MLKSISTTAALGLCLVAKFDSPGVVLGQLGQGGCPGQVSPRIADMADEGAIGLDEGQYDRCPHFAFLTGCFGGLIDLSIRRLNCFRDQRSDFRGREGLTFEGRGNVRSSCCGCLLAGHVTSVVPAQPVGHNEESDLFVNPDVVFILRSLQPFMAFVGNYDGHSRASCLDLWPIIDRVVGYGDRVLKSPSRRFTTKSS